MIKINEKLQEQFDKMCLTGKLFKSSVVGDTIWNVYIDSFDNDPIFRDPESSFNNCNLCKNFIRRYGNIIAIDENLDIMTMFDIDVDEQYKNSFKAVSELIKNDTISDIFIESYEELKKLPYEQCSKNQSKYKLGLAKNSKIYTKEEAEKFGVVIPGEVYTFNHLHVSINSQFIDDTNKSVSSLIAPFRDSKHVFKRAMKEISLETLILVKDLILQDSILDGKSHLHKIESMIPLKSEFDMIDDDEYKKDNWCWLKSYDFKYAMFKNELIGVLCSDISSGVDLNKACMDWNKRVDPRNYMKATAPITKLQIEQAKKFIQENGYEESFTRRCATIDDIKASDILHVNSGKGEIKNVSIFDNITPTNKKSKYNFDDIAEVTIDKFLEDILPGCSSVELFLFNSYKNNMVTLTTAENKDSKKIFKWDNNYSWTYAGNLAGKSQIKEAVKAVGGFVDAPFRFSIMWNEDGRDICDLDAHAIQPDGIHIYYGSYKDRPTEIGGMLDIDMIRPSRVGVENIFWSDKSKLIDGTYKFSINNFDGRDNKGFKCEIVFDNKVYSYVYEKPLFGTVNVANVILKDGKIETISHHIPCSNSINESINIYGLDSNNFYNVNLVCLSPNHWNNNVGNKHYFFFLDGCKSPDNNIRSFHNENIINELLEHRKVLEVLGTTLKVESTDNQLSGVGFNATVRDEVILRVKGSFNRIIKVKI